MKRLTNKNRSSDFWGKKTKPPQENPGSATGLGSNPVVVVDTSYRVNKTSLAVAACLTLTFDPMTLEMLSASSGPDSE